MREKTLQHPKSGVIPAPAGISGHCMRQAGGEIPAGAGMTESSSLPACLPVILTETCGSAPRIAIALSGGADSMALTLVAADWCAARGVAFIALTVDHSLRPESAAEAARVAAWMRARGIDHCILTPPPMPAIRNPQAQARERRYGALTAACHARGIDTLLLAHHADDQAETVALQRHRGGSPPSRAGMALVTARDGIRLVRPLLGTRKHCLVAWLESLGQPWIDDPTNASDRYARNRLRRALSEADTVRLWHEAQTQGEIRHRDERQRNAWFAAHARAHKAGVQLDRTAWKTLPDAARTDALSHAIRAVGEKAFRPRAHETARLDSRLAAEDSGAATLGHCRIRWDSHRIRITPERPVIDAPANPPHMPDETPAKLLVSEPFWWFNHPLSTE